MNNWNVIRIARWRVLFTSGDTVMSLSYRTPGYPESHARRIYESTEPQTYGEEIRLVEITASNEKTGEIEAYRTVESKEFRKK